MRTRERSCTKVFLNVAAAGAVARAAALAGKKEDDDGSSPDSATAAAQVGGDRATRVASLFVTSMAVEAETQGTAMSDVR